MKTLLNYVGVLFISIQIQSGIVTEPQVILMFVADGAPRPLLTAAHVENLSARH